MNTIIKSTVLGLTAIGLSTLSSRASLDYDFSYTYQDGQTISGEISGTISPYNSKEVFADSVISLTVNGVLLSSQVSVTSDGGGPIGIFSTDSSLISFIFITDSLVAAVDGFDNLELIYDAASSFQYDDALIPSPNSWTFTPAVSPVPEPSTILGGSLLLLPFGLSMVRILRKQKNG